MDDTYNVLLFLHVLLVVVWVGGAMMLQMLYGRVRRAGEPGRVAAYLSDVEFIGQRVFAPASALVLVLGFALVAKGDWDLGEFWILFALAGFAYSFLTGFFYTGPESGRLAEQIGEQGSDDDPEIRRRIGRLLLVARVELLIFAAIIYVMVDKPFLV